MLFLNQSVIAKVKSVSSPEPSTSMVGSSTVDKSTQCCTIVCRKDWADISANTVYARKKRLINLLLDTIRDVSV